MQNVALRTIRVFVIARPLLRWGLDRLVQSSAPRCEVVGGAARLAESVPLLQAERADVIVAAIDHESAEELSIFCAQSLGKVILVRNSSDHAFVDRAVIAGVRGIVHTHEPPQAVLMAIEKVDDGELWLDRVATGRMFMQMARHKTNAVQDPESSKMATLTFRERQTIAAVASDTGVPGKVIAQRLCISEHTLRNHLSSIYSKLNVCNRLDLYAYATRHGLQQHDSTRTPLRRAEPCRTASGGSLTPAR